MTVREQIEAKRREKSDAIEREISERYWANRDANILASQRDVIEMLLGGWEAVRPDDIAGLREVPRGIVESNAIGVCHPLVELFIISQGSELYQGMPQWRLLSREKALAWLEAHPAT